MTDGVNTWLVLDWEGVRNTALQPTSHSFQIWIGLNGNTPAGQDISFAYGPTRATAMAGSCTVGAENQFGNPRRELLLDGTGTLNLQG